VKLRTDIFVEHRTIGEQFGTYGSTLRPTCVLPGACTSCNGSSSTSCCSSLKERVENPVLANPIRTFDQAAHVFNVLTVRPLSPPGVSPPIANG